MRRCDAAVVRKLTQMRNGDNTIRNDKPGGKDADLWLEVIQKDLKLVKKALASRTFLPNLIQKGWLRKYAGLLLHRAVEKRAEAAIRRCPAPGSASESLWANKAVDDLMAVVAQTM